MEEIESRKDRYLTRRKRQTDRKTTVVKTVVLILSVVIFVILLVVIAVSLYLDYMIGLMNHVDGSGESISPEALESYIHNDKEALDPDFTGDILEPEDVVLETVGDATAEPTDVVNILLIGHDARPGEGRARSDSMILCSFNRVNGELTMVSFMRDLYVSIPDYGYYKMNAAYAWGDMSLLNKTILVNFGIEIDGDIAVDFKGFQKVIDRIGGVEVELTASEARYLNPYVYSAGVNCLDGKAALTYARIRSIGEGDFDRTSRQQKVMTAILEKCRKLSLWELNELLETILPLVHTNMKPGQIKSLASEFLPMLMELKIRDRQRIPMDGTYRYAWVSDMSVLMPDLAQNRQRLHAMLYGE